MIRPMIAALFSALMLIPAIAGEVQIKDIVKGTGEEADVGKTVTVHYTGWLMDGTKFDSSLDRNQPFSFTLGERRVIPGWEQGVVGMKVGGQARTDHSAGTRLWRKRSRRHHPAQCHTEVRSGAAWGQGQEILRSFQ